MSHTNSWFPMFPGDYLRDTLGLSSCEHGCYLLLLMQSWSRGPLPDDLDRLQRISGNPPMEILRYILETYWDRIDAGWVNARMEEIRANRIERSERLSEAGKRGMAKRWGGDNQAITTLKPGYKHPNKVAIASQNQNQNQNQNHIHTQTQKKEAPNGAMSGKPDVAGVERVLNHLNLKTGRQFKYRNGDGKVSKNAELVALRLKEHTEAELLAVIDLKVEAWGKSDKMSAFLRPATLFGREKCEQYVGEIGKAGAISDPWAEWAGEGDDSIEGECNRED